MTASIAEAETFPNTLSLQHALRVTVCEMLGNPGSALPPSLVRVSLQSSRASRLAGAWGGGGYRKCVFQPRRTLAPPLDRSPAHCFHMRTRQPRPTSFNLALGPSLTIPSQSPQRSRSEPVSSPAQRFCLGPLGVEGWSTPGALAAALWAPPALCSLPSLRSTPLLFLYGRETVYPGDLNHHLDANDSNAEVPL